MQGTPVIVKSDTVHTVLDGNVSCTVATAGCAYSDNVGIAVKLLGFINL
jgi:hypothetical protein